MPIGATIGPDRVDRMCDVVRDAILACNAEVVVCDLAEAGTPDAATVELLARLALTSRRLGRQMCLRQPAPELMELLAFMGLAGVRGLVLEAERQPEHREEMLRVEEEGDPGDPVA